ncbi:hypothetical protein [Botrimarina hoheduenensis]|uniref:hypothetical protein n=1 Tax=Botrimarina hoheduenensis TaxID=2528000 RepID=UPI0011B82AF8|nr:hypothetical protein [Botrimarina hoheduenensis]
MATLLCTGCGGPLDIVSVSGDVAYEDGTPLPLGEFRLKFVPLMESPDGKNFPRVANAVVGADGRIESVTTHKYNDGLIRGKHRVYLLIGDCPDDKPIVAEAYCAGETTPLEIDVAQQRKLQIRVPKP